MVLPKVGGNAGHWMTVRYALALTVIALCTLTASVMTESVIVRHQDTLEVVNVSGRQRMLSQRTALLVDMLRRPMAEQEREAVVGELTTAIAEFEAAHRRLTGMGPEPPLGAAVRDLYFDGPEPLNGLVYRHIDALRNAALVAESGPVPDAMAATIAAAALGPLLARLEEMVARYQHEGERGLRLVQDLGRGALALTLLTLIAEALVIFRPMVRHVQRQFAEITRMAESLERSNERLEDQVRVRTAELAAARDAAEAAHRAKSRFLAHASHDLMQPLQAVGMFTGMLERQADPAKSKGLLNDLRAAQRSMRGLLTAILDISRLESGVVEPKPAAMPVGPLLDQLAAEYAPLAEERGLRFSAPSCGATVVSDPALLERILRNFLANALRYTAAGGLLVGARRRGGLLWLEVHDTGRGIPEADRRRIFEEFIQLDRDDRDRGEGIGLGLAIVDRLARLLGHPVAVRSVEGRGSVFAVGVPLA